MAAVEQPDETITTPPGHPKHIDELLDEAIEESFPASDPVSITIDNKPLQQEDTEERPDDRR